MNIFIILLFLLIVINCKIYFKDYNSDFISKDECAAIKGIFILIVFLSHSFQYATFDSNWDIPLKHIILSLGQLMVTLFLFYSGYGVAESIKKKKEQYMSSFMKNRVLKTYFNFAIFILIYLVMNLILKIDYPIKTILLAFTGWTGIGNSNWYIYGIICLYLLTFISYKITKGKKLFIPVNFVMCCILIYVLHIVKESWWYNTLLCYPAGMLFSTYKDKFIQFYTNEKGFSNIKYIISFAILIGLFFLTYKFNTNYIVYELYSVVFCLLVVFITLKINIRNKVLIYSGNNLFYLYMSQRIPMIILKHFNYNTNTFLFLVISLVSTFVLCFITSKGINKLDKILFKNKAIKADNK